MNTISTTIEYNGAVIKVENNKVYTRAFGTTIYNHSMHWSWIEITDKMTKSLRDYLKENNLFNPNQ